MAAPRKPDAGPETGMAMGQKYFAAGLRFAGGIVVFVLVGWCWTDGWGRPPPSWPWERSSKALLPLDSAGKLGIVLFQFPPWYLPGDEQRDYILSCKQKLPQYRIAVEFRHNSWVNEKNRERTFSFLRDHNLPFVCVDEPQGFKSSVPPIAEATSDIGLVRFHGRNSDTWEKKGIGPAERFNYLYTEEELRPWTSKIAEISQQTTEMHVLFNNCYQDKAVVNARQMCFMLGTQGRPQMARE